jgi:hypothetical protein
MTNGSAIGVCGESNARNSFGGYTGFGGFVVWRDPDGKDNIGHESRDELENIVYKAYAKNVGCYSGPL